MAVYLPLFSGVLLFILCPALSIVHRSRPHHNVQRDDIQYKTEFFTQQVDHFSFVNQDVYQQRYLVADQYWDPDKGPIFFYTGNEGDIAWFCNNTGLMWDWAPKFKAMLVFAEHRYYGESLPYGKKAFADLTRAGYLSSEQALADFATLIHHIKSSQPKASDKPVITFGGSYGGMLSAWFRMKYPHVVQGALAASAPIWLFGNLVPCEGFYQTVTNDFKREGEQCAVNIAKSWDVIRKMGSSSSGRQTLKDTFHLCKSLAPTDVDVLVDWLEETYVNMAMVDYPYAASFLEPLPAWPVKQACKYLNLPSLHDTELLHGVSQIVQLYYNYTGSTSCLDIQQQATQDLGDMGWDFQACTEMVMPICTDGKKDMFPPKAWDMKQRTLECKMTWGTVLRPNWILEQYGGRNITAASNIIFSNGDLDPWAVGGVLISLSDSLIAIQIEEGAHHLDLRTATPHDPPSVVAARQKEYRIIQQWIEEYWREVRPNWNWLSSYLYTSSTFGQDAPEVSEEDIFPVDFHILFGTALFMIGGAILLCYLRLAQNIRHYTGKRCVKQPRMNNGAMPRKIDLSLLLDEDQSPSKLSF